MFEELFYKRLTQLRMAKGVSARDMSLSLGQSAGYINGLENHNGLPSMMVFFYICEYFGITPMEFFDDGNACPNEMRETVNDLKSLKSERFKIVSAVIKELKQ